MIVRTLQAEFAHLRCSRAARRASSSRAKSRWLHHAPSCCDATRSPHPRDTRWPPAGELVDELLLSDDDLRRLTEDVAAANDGPIISRDDNLFLEYATPKGNVLNYDASLAECMAMLRRYHPPDVRAKHLGD